MSRKNLIIIIIAALFIALFGFLNIIELRAEEPRRAIVSLEMLLSGEWIVPHINGWVYYNKPPLFNWLMGTFFTLMGNYGEWVVRLPSLLSFALLAILNYRFTAAYVDKKTALLSSLFLLTGADILFYGSVNSGEIDLFFALLVYLQVMAIFKGFHHKEYLRMFLLSYLWMSLGFLTKGMPSLAFQVFTLLIMAVYYRKFLLLFSWKHFMGILLFVVSCGFYLYLYDQQDNALAFLVRQFKEASQRTGLETDIWDTVVQSISFPFRIMALLLPWSLLILYFFRNNFLKTVSGQPFLLFSVLFLIANIPLYWLSGDFKARYYYMFFPFIFVLIAYFIVHKREISPRFNTIIFTTFNILACIVPLAFISLFFVEEVMSFNHSVYVLPLFIVLSILLAFRQMKKSYKILNMILIMVMLRLALNIFYLPALQKFNSGMHYRDSIAGMLEITRDAPVYLYGDAYEFYSDATIGPLTLEEVKLTTAPLLAYQIPYYISRANGHVLKFTEEMIEGEYNLMPEEKAESKNYEILYTIHDRWTDQKWILIKP